MSARSFRRLVPLAVMAGLAVLSGRASAVTYTWTAAATGNWSTPGNWSGSVVPTSGATSSLIFSDAAGGYTATDDLVANPFVLNNMTFNNLVGNVVGIGGTNALNFQTGATAPTISLNTGNVSIAQAVQLGVAGTATNLTFNSTGGTLTLNGGIIDNSGLAVGSNVVTTGTGTLTFAGAANTSIFNQLSIRGGTVNVTGGTVLLTNPSAAGGPSGSASGVSGLQIGNSSGQTGTLNISGGSTVSVLDNIYTGDAAGSTGTINVTGSGTVLTNLGLAGGLSNRMAVGYLGNGSLNITAGAVVNTALIYIARSNLGTVGSTGSVLVDGIGSQLNINPSNPPGLGLAQLVIGGGVNSIGSLTASNGATVTIGTGGNSFIGNAAGATANMTFSSGATLNMATGFLAGNTQGATANITFTGTGTTGTLAGNLWLGSNTAGTAGTATLNILNGATVANTGGIFTVGNIVTGGNGGSGTVNVSGVGSSFTEVGQVTIAADFGSVGVFNVTGGATATFQGPTFIGPAAASGTFPAATGTVSVSGAGSTLTVSNATLIVGGGNSPGGIGTVNVSNGGLFAYTGTGFVTVGQDIGASGFLNVTSGGIFDATGHSIIVGGVGTSTPVSLGTINVSGGMLNANQISLGGGFTGTAGGNGVMNVSAGGLVNTNFMIVGGFDATVTGAGTLNVNGGRVLVSTELDLADGGAGVLNITNGGLVSVGANGFAGATAGFVGTATVSGYQSTLRINGQVQLGGQGGTAAGTGSITGNSGAQVILGDTILYAAGSLAVNTDTTGSFTVNDVRDGTGGPGSISIGTNSTLTINNTTNGISIFSGSISGAGSLTKTGGGNQILTGTNSYTGTTNVNGGILGFGAASNLGTGGITFNGGTLQWLNNGSANTTDITAGPTAVTLNGGGGTFDTNFNAITLANPIGGIGGLTVIGGGTLTLGGTNTYFGTTTIANGVLVVTADANLGSATGPLGGVNTVNGTPDGTLIFSGTTPINTTRLYHMGGGTIATDIGQSVTFNGSQVTGATLDGTGTVAAPNFVTGTNGAQFNHVSTTSSVVLSSTSVNDQFFHFNNGGSLSVAAGVNSTGASTLINFSDFNNLGSGSLTIGAGSQVSVANFQSSGLLTLPIAPTGSITLITNRGTSPMNFNGGSRTFIGSPPATFLAGIDLHGNNGIVAGGLFVNNGFVIDSTNPNPNAAHIVADFGALVKGAGYFQTSVVTQNGGKFQSGNSPGAARFGSFVFGPGGVDNYVFAIDDATGQAGPSPSKTGLVSGWGLVKAIKQTVGSIVSSGDFNWTATPNQKLTVALDTLVNPTMVGTDIPGMMADFDPTKSYSWLAASWAGTYSGPTDPALLNAATSFDTSGFLNPVAGKFGWAINPASDSLSLTYTPSPVPEPSTLALVGVTGIAAGWLRRRRNAKVASKS